MQLAMFLARVICVATLAFVTACSYPGASSSVTPSAASAGRAGPLFSATFVYGVNGGGNNVSAYKIGAAGALVSVPGSPFAAGTGPEAMTIVWTYDSAGNVYHTWAYVVDNTANAVTAYSVNVLNGALTQITGSPFSAGTGPIAVAAAPSGPFLYVANSNSNNVSAYRINVATGALTVVAGSPFAAGTSPDGVVVSTNGFFAYVSNAGSNNVTAYKITPNTGKLTQLASSPFSAGTGPAAVATDYSGSWLYVPNYSSNNISAYAMNPHTGVLSAVSGSPFSSANGPIAIALGHRATTGFAYVANAAANKTSGYKINGSGQLIATPNSPYSAGTLPHGVTVESGVHEVYVINQTSNNISGYHVHTNGSLATMSGSPFSAGNTPFAIVSCMSDGTKCTPPM
jgi:6-phosphogluconolactonase (cycloisomerase 2 family)